MSIKGDVVYNWKEFEAAWGDYLIATQLDAKLRNHDDSETPAGMAMVAATLCTVMGQACRGVLANLPALSAEDKKKPDKIIEALREYFIPQRNILYERFVFNTTTQKPGESIDVFSLRLRQLAESCDFGQLKDQLIRDRIVIGTTDDLGRERILRERPVPDLNRVIENLRAAEMSRNHREVMTRTAKDSPIDHVSKSNRKKSQDRPHSQKPTYVQNNKSTNGVNHSRKPRCNYCGKDKHARKDCPAKDSLCKKCQKKGHWAAVCRSKASHEIEEMPVTCNYLGEANEISVREEADTPIYLGEVNSIDEDFWSAKVHVNNHSTDFKLDSGSKICVISYTTPWINGIKLMKTNAEFIGPGGVSLNHSIVGLIPHAKLRVESQTHVEDIYVMKNQSKNLLSKSAIQALNLLKPASAVYAVESPKEFIQEFPDVFKGLGLLKDSYKIPLREDATPFSLYTPRRVPHPLLPKVKAQLEKMEKSGVISAVTEPTEWCSGMVVVPKPSVEVRICADLTQLYKAVQ